MSEAFIEWASQLPYAEQLRHWGGMRPWHFDGHDVQLPPANRLVTPGRTGTDGVGAIKVMPDLIGRPCFGQVTAYLMHGRQDEVFSRRHERSFKTRCSRCEVRMACRKVNEERKHATPEIIQAIKEWEVAGGPYAMKNPARYRTAVHRWHDLIRALERHGPFFSCNDQVVADHIARRREERKVAERDRKRDFRARKQAQLLASRQLSPDLRQLLAEEYQRRIKLLEDVRIDPACPSTFRQPGTDVGFTAKVWAVKTGLEWIGVTPNASRIARNILRGQSGATSTHNRLRSTIARALVRIERLERQQPRLGGKVLWPPLPLDQALKQVEEGLQN